MNGRASLPTFRDGHAAMWVQAVSNGAGSPMAEAAEMMRIIFMKKDVKLWADMITSDFCSNRLLDSGSKTWRKMHTP
jgi:hypothetical protein